MSALPVKPASALPQRVGAVGAGPAKPKEVRVKVAVRVRPFLPHETARGDENIIQSMEGDALELWNYRYESEALRYTCDEVICTICPS